MDGEAPVGVLPFGLVIFLFKRARVLVHSKKLSACAKSLVCSQ
jgi:hypothetical protein